MLDYNARFIFYTICIFDTKEAKGKESILPTHIVLDGYGLGKESEAYKLDKYIVNKMEIILHIIENSLRSSGVIELICRLENSALVITGAVIYLNSLGYKRFLAKTKK